MNESLSGLCQFILSSKPCNILLLGQNDSRMEELWQPLKNYTNRVSKCSIGDVDGVLQSTNRFSLVFILDEFGTIPVQEGRHLIAKLRDLHAERLLMLQRKQGAGWGRTEFLSLGFKMIRGHLVDAFRIENGHLELYEYNVQDYKNNPDWLNSRFWANPENWNKSRW